MTTHDMTTDQTGTAQTGTDDFIAHKLADVLTTVRVQADAQHVLDVLGFVENNVCASNWDSADRSLTALTSSLPVAMWTICPSLDKIRTAITLADMKRAMIYIDNASQAAHNLIRICNRRLLTLSED